MFPIAKIVTFSAATAWAVLAFHGPQFVPPNAKPAALQANDTGYSINVETAVRAIVQNRGIIRREPLNAPVLRDLALASAGGDLAAAQAGLEHSERVSRRDQWSQLFLIEGSAQRGQIGAALQRYDNLLLLGSELSPLLLQRLSASLASAEVRQGLRPYARRLWMHRLLQTAATSVADPLIVYNLGQDLGLLTPQLPDETVRKLLAALTAKGHYAEAAALADKVAAPDARHWRGFGFSAPATHPRLSPLTWDFANGADLLVSLDSSHRLNVIEISGKTASVASRVLALSPGAYAVSLSIEGNESRLNDFRFEISCIARGRATPVPATATYAGGVTTTRFALPRPCPLQSAQLMYRPDDHQGSRQFRLGPLSLAPDRGLR
jgi:hypothetical protein